MRDVRIQKVLAEQGVCSRRAAEQLIREGRVKLNGRPVTVGDKMDTLKDLLTVDGQKVYVPKKSEKYYYMMYKPRGYITTTNDERGRKTVMDLIADVPVRVYPVGRLDKDSEGLLLLTNDGDFANLLTHPSHGVSKLYRVTVRPHATEEQIIALTDGVVLDDGSKTLPAAIHVVTDEPERTVLEMTIREGKNRQIRRMCEAVGLDVIRLRRSALGAVKLGMLQPGQYRELTSQEVTALRTAASRGKATATIAKNTAARRAPHRGWAHGPRAPKGAVAAEKNGEGTEHDRNAPHPGIGRDGAVEQRPFRRGMEGYVVMDGPKYLGHMLYRVDGDGDDVLECGLEENILVDGAVRACVAAGKTRAHVFPCTCRRRPGALTKCLSRTHAACGQQGVFFRLRHKRRRSRRPHGTFQCVRPKNNANFNIKHLSLICQNSIMILISEFF